MKKVLIAYHGVLPLNFAIKQALEKERGITIVSEEQAKEQRENDYFKNEALKLKCFSEAEPMQQEIFDKPKSKYHK